MLKLLIPMVLLIFSGYTVAAEPLYWYLASSMSKPGKVVVKAYNHSQTEVTVRLITGGSGQLLNKIKTSGKGDVYTAASDKFMDLACRLGLVKKSYPFLMQTPVFALSSSTHIITFDDLLKPGVRIALGKISTMALGKKYIAIESRMDPNTAKLIRQNTKVSGLNISHNVNYLKTGAVDAALLFDTTAKANGLRYVDIPKDANNTAMAKIAILNTSQSPKAATKFIAYVMEQKGTFQQFGFDLLENKAK